MRGFRLVKNADLGPDNPTVHDLILVGGDFATVDDDETTAQEIKTRLLFFRGENFADLREGIPYFTDIFRKGVDENRARSIIRQAILSVPSIVDVDSIELTIERLTRVMTVNWRARTNTGTVVSSEDFGPLVIAEENKPS